MGFDNFLFWQFWNPIIVIPLGSMLY
jgi:uncharacterized integral membrane protein